MAINIQILLPFSVFFCWIVLLCCVQQYVSILFQRHVQQRWCKLPSTARYVALLLRPFIKSWINNTTSEQLNKDDGVTEAVETMKMNYFSGNRFTILNSPFTALLCNFLVLLSFRFATFPSFAALFFLIRVCPLPDGYLLLLVPLQLIIIFINGQPSKLNPHPTDLTFTNLLPVPASSSSPSLPARRVIHPRPTQILGSMEQPAAGPKM